MANEIREKNEKEELFREWLEKKLPAQYRERTDMLNNVGLLDLLSSGEMGIVGVNGIEYPLPTFEDIKGEIEANEELYKQKIEQGFGEIEIVPFGLPVERFIRTLKERIFHRKKEGELYLGKEEISSFVIDDPIGVDDDFEQDNLIYIHHSTDHKRNKLTKEEMLERVDINGFRVYLRESQHEIPEAKKEKIKAGRRQVETGLPLRYYLTPPREMHNGERTITIEDWVVLALYFLEKDKKLIDMTESGTDTGERNCVLSGQADRDDRIFTTSLNSTKNSLWGDDESRKDGLVIYSRRVSYKNDEFGSRYVIGIGKFS